MKQSSQSPIRSSIYIGVMLILLLMLLITLGGCGHDEEPATPKKPRGSTPGVSSVQYEQQALFNPLALTIKPDAVPEPKPTAPMPAGATCITSGCHADYAAAPRLHGPLVSGTCEACHEPDTGNHTFPLKRQANNLCTFCHTVAGTQQHQHVAVTENGCMSCHKPHVADNKFLLTHDTVGQLCRSCHDIPVKKFAHSPFAEQQCTVCHFPHQSNTKALLRGGEGPQHCLSCHTGIDERLQLVTLKHEPATKQCTTCHNAHTSDNPRMLEQPVRENCLSCHEKTAEQIQVASVKHEALDDERSCVNCHDPHGSSVRKLLAGRENDLCLNCHNQRIEAKSGRVVPDMTAVLNKPYLHGPVESGDCSGCHNTHGSTNLNLLREPFPDRFYATFNIENYGLCFDCHTADLVRYERTDSLTNFRDGDLNLHYLHVHRDEKGRTCKACHAIHGSDHPLHIADAVPFEGSDWPLPIRFVRSLSGGSCSPGCHEPMQYNRNEPVNHEPATVFRSDP